MYRMDNPPPVNTLKASTFNDRLAEGLVRAGAVRILESLPRRPQLMVINYHRIGNSTMTGLDPGVFSTDSNGLDEQIKALRRRFTFISPSEALDVIEMKVIPKEPLALLTFDDGYRDNLTQAYPVLTSHGLKAIFFVVTSYLESPQVPWWDRLASLVRVITLKNHSTSIALHDARMLEVTPHNLKNSIKQVLENFKACSPSDQQEFESYLRRLAGINSAQPHSNDHLEHVVDGTGDTDLMMSWEDVKTLDAAGMTIGAHSHTHRILSALDKASQQQEIRSSKRILESFLTSPVDFLAFPDGRREAFNSETMLEAQEAGFRAAFSFYGGTNLAGSIRPFDVRRSSIPRTSSGVRLRIECARMGSAFSR
jgi:peptidoglycan/xylan/chitin deacetylase (PgdA/CDA1 family)